MSAAPVKSLRVRLVYSNHCTNIVVLEIDKLRHVSTPELSRVGNEGSCVLNTKCKHAVLCSTWTRPTVLQSDRHFSASARLAAFREDQLINQGEEAASLSFLGVMSCTARFRSSLFAQMSSSYVRPLHTMPWRADERFLHLGKVMDVARRMPLSYL